MPNMDFSTFPEFSVARQSKVGRLLHYLYDFLFRGKKGTNHYAVTMSVFSHKMAILDIPIAMDKTDGQQTRICFLGVGN